MSDPDSSKAFTKTPSHYVVPTRILEARQGFSVHQKRMVALAMLALQQERNRLYEIDPKGKEAAKSLSPAEKRLHYNNYIPDHDMMMKANRYHTYDHEVLTRFFNGSVEEIRRAIRRATAAIPNKSVILTENERTLEVMTPIPYAKYQDGVLTLGVLDLAVPYLMDHSLGYSSSDLSVWCNLSSQHSQRLLELVSKHKERERQRIALSDFKRMFGVDFAVYEDKDEAEKAGKRLGDYKMQRDDKGKSERIPKYKAFKDFRRHVLDVAFPELIKASKGMWSATDDEGKGYRLHRKGKTYHDIEICLRHTDLEQERKKLAKSEKESKQASPDPALQLIESLEFKILGGVLGEANTNDINLYEMLVLQTGHVVGSAVKANIALIKEQQG
ncbi:replication initiation protein [Enterovibrio calviensis]|uniref:replication initiation protein n=1 Tax=Enterovibrio calviensis TaxID=91359 RepID=UPI003735670C